MSAGDVRWDPARRLLDPSALEGVDAVVTLAGAPVLGSRFAPGHARAVHDSRLHAARLLVESFARMDAPPAVLVHGSAIGAYGSRGDEHLDERSSRGDGFLAGVIRDAETAADGASALGTRVVHARTGVVLAPGGGAAAPLLLGLRLGAEVRLGGGRQFWSWITLEDEVRALEHLLTSELSGPVDLTAPGAARARELVAALGTARGGRVRIPVPIPAWAVRAALGVAAEAVLSSQRVAPRALLADGFTFVTPTLDAAAAWVLAPRDDR